MRGRDRFLVSTVWALALVMSLVLAACGGSGESAEEAWQEAVLLDPGTDDVVGKPVLYETLELAAFDSFVQAESERAAHLQMAAEMGYTAVLAAGRVTYDNGAVITSAALAGENEGDLALLVVGAMAGDGTTADPPESVFIAQPVVENGELVRIDITSEDWAFTFDPAAGEVDLIEETYGSCSTGNCIAGAVLAFIKDDSAVKAAYLNTLGIVCINCCVSPPSAPVTCPACALLIGAPIAIQVTDCAIWPCDLCLTDSCHTAEYENQHCVTENGVSEVRSSVTPWYCNTPGEWVSECVEGTTVTEVEACPWGCRPGSPTCMYPMQCLVGLQNCYGAELDRYCLGNDIQIRSEKMRCVSDDPAADNVWGECVPQAYQYEYDTITCPYTCADGTCQPPPTCDPAICELFERPLGEPYCTVRPDDGKSVVVQEIEPRGCVTVEPRVPLQAVWADWPEGESCEALDPTLRVIEACPGACTADGTACAPVCEPSTCDATTAGETSCSYDYQRYKRYQRFETSACQPLLSGGSTCAVVEDELREMGPCPWGCTADGTDCAPDTRVPEAPGEFMVLQGSAPGKTEFLWTDYSPDEQGFHIYHGGCSTTPAQPCTLIGTVGANQSQVLLDWQRPEGGDRCWEIRAFNTVGESAPAWYCLPD
jgi:hypothetical protein